MDTQGKRIVVFAGAGASFAVSKTKYPTTAGFIERFPKDVLEDPFFERIKGNLAAKFGGGPPDVEKILWCIEELIDYLQKANDPKSPISWFLPNNVLPGLVGAPGEVVSYARMAPSVERRLVELRGKINAHLYEIYDEVPTSDELSESWGFLLPELVRGGWWVDLITTNYDLVIEESVDLHGLDIGYGRGRGAIAKLDTNKWLYELNDGDRPYAQGLITKLHGSLNWERDKRNGVVFGGPQFKTDHKHHVAIYPGFKGVPKDEPFSLFHDYFERALQKAECVIFIGFAFRDEYINTLLMRAPHRKYFVIDPSELSELPNSMGERIFHIKEGFGRSSVQKLLTKIKIYKTRP